VAGGERPADPLEALVERAGALLLAEAHELLVLAEQLHPPQQFGDREGRALDHVVVAVGAPAAEETVLLDVADAVEQLVGGIDERLGVAADQALGLGGPVLLPLAALGAGLPAQRDDGDDAGQHGDRQRHRRFRQPQRHGRECSARGWARRR
jgi:hypothetical protein